MEAKIIASRTCGNYLKKIHVHGTKFQSQGQFEERVYMLPVSW